MNKLIVVLMLAALLLQAESRTIKDQVESVSVFSDVTVGLLDGAQVRGRLVKSEAEELVLRVQEGNTFTDRTIQLSQIKSFKENKPGWLRRTAETVGIAVVAPFFIVGWLFFMLFGGDMQL
jgi:hypothetical protein